MAKVSTVSLSKSEQKTFTLNMGLSQYITASDAPVSLSALKRFLGVTARVQKILAAKGLTIRAGKVVFAAPRKAKAKAKKVSASK